MGLWGVEGGCMGGGVGASGFPRIAAEAGEMGEPHHREVSSGPAWGLTGRRWIVW